MYIVISTENTKPITYHERPAAPETCGDLPAHVIKSSLIRLQFSRVPCSLAYDIEWATFKRHEYDSGRKRDRKRERGSLDTDNNYYYIISNTISVT